MSEDMEALLQTVSEGAIDAARVCCVSRRSEGQQRHVGSASQPYLSF